MPEALAMTAFNSATLPCKCACTTPFQGPRTFSGTRSAAVVVVAVGAAAVADAAVAAVVVDAVPLEGAGDAADGAGTSPPPPLPVAVSLAVFAMVKKLVRTFSPVVYLHNTGKADT